MDAEEWAMFTGSPDSGYVPVDEGGGFDAGYEQFNPAATDMSQVVGTPVADEQCWDCLLYTSLSFQSHDPSQRSQGFLTLAGGLVVTFARCV